MAAFLANVGVNAGHRVRSLLDSTGTFRLHPIPESLPWAPPMLRRPEAWGERAVHLDPDFESATPTYGDNCRTAGRAYSLRQAERGDVIVFVARLHPQDGSGPPGFYLVGQLHVEEVRRDLVADPGPGWWDANAHVRRARAGGQWNSFWVFRGRPDSGLFGKAVPFARREAERVFTEAWHWPASRTELQTIASHTRAVRRLTAKGEDHLRSLCPS